MPEKYTRNMDGIAGFGFTANALGGGGDAGQSFPRSDAGDMSQGAHFIPDKVTLARRRGEHVKFVDLCSPCCWYWEFEGGTRVYHWDRPTYEKVKGDHLVSVAREKGLMALPKTDDYELVCPHCGNPHMRGGTVNT